MSGNIFTHKNIQYLILYYVCITHVIFFLWFPQKQAVKLTLWSVRPKPSSQL